MKRFLDQKPIRSHLNGDGAGEPGGARRGVAELFDQRNSFFPFPKKQRHWQSGVSEGGENAFPRNFYWSENPRARLKRGARKPEGPAQSQPSAGKPRSGRSPGSEAPAPKKETYLNKFLEAVSKQERLNKELVRKNNQKHQMNDRLVDTNLKCQRRCGPR